MTKRILLIALSLALWGTVSFAFADAPIDGRAGRAELRFMQGMIDHHQMALDMANDCLANAETSDVQALCQAVIDAQTPEIEQMQTWLAAWYAVDYQPMSMLPADDGMAGMDHSTMNMGGMATDPAGMMGMMAGLSRAEGIAYDIAWLESMIDHHDDAIHMAERILARGEHAALLTLAQNIIDAQSAEIATMEALIVVLEG
jgi:uncharacterized protein (DUF305 family)